MEPANAPSVTLLNRTVIRAPSPISLIVNAKFMHDLMFLIKKLSGMIESKFASLQTRWLQLPSLRISGNGSPVPRS